MSGAYVRVGAHGERYAFAVEHVTEVGRSERLTPLHHPNPFLIGMCNLRGEVLPVFDFAALVGGERGGSRARLLVVELGTLRAGLAVDEVDDVAVLAATPTPSESPLVPFAALVDGSLLGVVDVPELFARLQLR
jgi:chemotaxis signal transduction protein